MNNKNLILVDVDGPLNPYGAKPTQRPEGYSTHRLAPLGINPRKPLRVWLNQDHGAMLMALADQTNSELVWATTWEHDANKMIGPIVGLPELPVIEFGFKAFQWKYNAVLEYCAGRRFVWFDDQFQDFKKELRWFENNRKEPCLLHHVDPKKGLLEEDFIKAHDWLRKE